MNQEQSIQFLAKQALEVSLSYWNRKLALHKRQCGSYRYGMECKTIDHIEKEIKVIMGKK